MATSERRYAAKSATERRADRRARLLEAALDAFATHGYRSTSIEQLCATARISTRNFYEEVSGKEELLVTLHDDVNARALEAVVEALADIDPDDLEARAHAGVEAYFRLMTQDPRWARITLVESVGVSPEVYAHRRSAIDRFAELIRLEFERLTQAGVLPPRDYRLTTVALVGAIESLVNTWTADPEWDRHFDQVVEEAAAIIVAAARR